MPPKFLLDTFPLSIEKWWWEQACQQWPEISEDKLLNLIRQEIVKQSDRFNKFRNFDCDAYGKRDLSILAYGNFYFSRSWTAMNFAIGEAIHLRGWNPPKNGPIRILDLGSGTGASGLSCLHTIRKSGLSNQIQLEAIDYSGKSLAFLRKLHLSQKDLWPDTQITTKRLDLKFPLDEIKRKKYDLILLGFSLNELLNEEENEQECFKQVLFSLPERLKSNGLAVITEPAQRGICHLLHKKCAEIIPDFKDLFIHSPYFNGKSCPLSQTNSKFFSHEVRKILPLSTVEKINRPLNLEVREVKFGLSMIGYLQPKILGKSHEICRIVSPLKKRKGTVSFVVINGDSNELTYELQRRNLPKEDLVNLMDLERGDILKINLAEDSSQEFRHRIQNLNQIQPIFMPRVRQDESSKNSSM